jgi:hypothetical protein
MWTDSKERCRRIVRGLPWGGGKRFVEVRGSWGRGSVIGCWRWHGACDVGVVTRPHCGSGTTDFLVLDRSCDVDLVFCGHVLVSG